MWVTVAGAWFARFALAANLLRAHHCCRFARFAWFAMGLREDGYLLGHLFRVAPLGRLGYGNAWRRLQLQVLQCEIQFSGADVAVEAGDHQVGPIDGLALVAQIPEDLFGIARRHFVCCAIAR